MKGWRQLRIASDAMAGAIQKTTGPQNGSFPITAEDATVQYGQYDVVR